MSDRYVNVGKTPSGKVRQQRVAQEKTRTGKGSVSKKLARNKERVTKPTKKRVPYTNQYGSYRG